jgi:ARG/rhodanese/phosphatase superfamily protein
MASHRLSHGKCVRWSTVAALAALGILWSASGRVTTLRASEQSTPTPLAALASGFTLEGPFTHANLTVYVVRGSTTDAREYITLDEGLAARTVAVRERTRAGQDQAEVNTLEIENRSDKWLFLQAGDIVKGGKQDRTIMTDLTLAPHAAPQPIEAFCVEHGRWTQSQDGLAFRNNPGIVAGAPLKIAIQGEKSQPRVWQEVAKAEGRAVKAARAAGAPMAADVATLSSTGTYNAIAENKTLSTNRDAYVTALLPQIRKHPNAIGLAIAINGKVTSADVYASHALFQRLSGKLLNSYALEGVLAGYASPQTTTAPTRQQVIAFLSRPSAARAASETVGTSMQRSTRETDDMVMYEYGQVSQPASAKKSVAVVHQSYLKK